MKSTDKSVELLQLLWQQGGNQSQAADDVTGFKILRVVTSEPAAYTFVFEGTEQALPLDLFEIPVACYPLIPGDRLLVYPIVGNGMRWAAFTKLNNAVTMADVTSPATVQVAGIGRPYGASDLILPEGGTLPAGKLVSLQPTYSAGKIKYAVLNIHEGG
jgi:hypothetical protein